MKKQTFFYFLLVILCLFFWSCPARPQIDYVTLNDSENFPEEAAFLRGLFENSGISGLVPLPAGVAESAFPKAETLPEPAIIIDFHESLGKASSVPDGSGGILVSQVWLVPREDPLAGRSGTTLALCTGGEETLIPLTELNPPYVTLRVDGFSVEDEDYPLVREARISIRAANSQNRERTKREQKRVDEKIAALEGLLRDSPKPLVAEAPQILWVASAGDLMLDRGASDILFREGPEGIFGGTAAFLAGSDLALVNLEGAVSSRGEKVKKSFNFRFDPKVAPALRDSGIDAVLLANNHAFDYGETAFLDTLTHLQEANIGILGAGLSDIAAALPWTFQKGGTTVQVFGLASYPRERNGWDGLNVAAEPEKPGLLHAGKGGGDRLKANFIREKADALDIVLFHGGEEWSRRPNTATRQLYTDLIQQGADLVIGSHPHVVQGFEWIEGKPVFWSLGNYVFGGMDNTEGGEEGLFIRLGFIGSRMIYLDPYPLTLTHTRTSLAPPEKLKNFYTLSKAFTSGK
ncbi:hypothetical protein FACS1894140_0480 [Spirochaetia bacterium]|nr:hypothetical protein FACS1894140_0480 [Spirochaetia bacterium]